MSPVVYLVPYCFWSASRMICSYVRPLMWGVGYLLDNSSYIVCFTFCHQSETEGGDFS